MNESLSLPLKHCGLVPETIASMQQIFARHARIDKVVLYGSRAKGNYKVGSDIDLTIYAEKLTHAELMNIENELDELLLPYQIDLCWHQKIDNAQLREHIKCCGIVFYTHPDHHI